MYLLPVLLSATARVVVCRCCDLQRQTIISMEILFSLLFCEYGQRNKKVDHFVYGTISLFTSLFLSW
jgi:hypothetical protein